MNKPGNTLDYFLSPEFVRDSAEKILSETVKGNTHFDFHPDQLEPTCDFVIGVIRENYPDLKIPFHSRWGHFRVGHLDRAMWLREKFKEVDPLEFARIQFDLVIPSVLLDAGAGASWKYFEKH